ncbi:MAG: Ppx/GppA family phosphatase [Rhodobacteraceae bacterium]|nr:Ppx/GppA family phosphatase [Paracoccaceae bacterium]
MTASTDIPVRRLPDTVEPPQPQPAGKVALYAALDLGTNSCRMLIAQPSGSQFRVVDSFSKTVQLGRGLERHGSLSNASIGRTIAALRTCRNKLEIHGVSRMRMVATEACRRASNGAEFLKRVAGETGLTLEVIQPEEEACLAVVSCAPLVAPETRQLLVVDIGGGSTELIWLDLSKIEPGERAQAIMRLRAGFRQSCAAAQQPVAAVVDWISVPVGVATLKDQFDDVGEDGAKFALMSCFFEECLDNFLPYRNAGPGDCPPEPDFQIIGTSGTVTTVAASHLGLRRYDRNKVDGLSLTSAEIDAVIRNYLTLGPEGRRRDPRIGRDRQALILSGVAILQTLMRIWPTERLSVADRGLREGLLYAQMCADGVLADGAF